MYFTSVLVAASAVTLASAVPWSPPVGSSGTGSGVWFPNNASTTTYAPGAASTCLTDAAATSLALAFSGMLTDVNRTAANVTGQIIIADNFTETSDSILSLEHQPLGSVTFLGKQLYLENVVHAPPIPSFTTMDIIHDCTKILWYWTANGIGNAKYEVKGFNLMYTTSNGTQILDNRVEFNSLAWGADIFNTAVNLTTVQ